MNAAMNINVPDSDSKLLKDIRDKIVYHYDLQKIGSGYESRFKNVASDADRPFVSLGNNQIESRFYFADATSEGCISLEIGSDTISDLNDKLDRILGDINFSLFHIVKAYIPVTRKYL